MLDARSRAAVSISVRTVRPSRHSGNTPSHVYSPLIKGPEQLKGPFDATDFPLGCKSACGAGINYNNGKTPPTRHSSSVLLSSYNSHTQLGNGQETPQTAAQVHTTHPKPVHLPPWITTHSSRVTVQMHMHTRMTRIVERLCGLVLRIDGLIIRLPSVLEALSG